MEDTEQLAGLIERGGAADTLRMQLDEAGRRLEDASLTRLRQESVLSRLREAARGTTVAMHVAAEHAALAAILERVPGPSSQPLADKLEGLVNRSASVEAATASLTGQNAQMRTQLARLKGNGGSGMPNCWVLPNGLAQEMLKVEMQDTGVIVRDLEPRAWPEEDSAWPLLDGVSRGRLMPLAEFVA